MCRFCPKLAAADMTLEDAQTLMKIHGFVLIPPNSPKQFAVGWDGRALATSESRGVAQAGVDKALEEGQVGRWELLERYLGPWQAAGPERPKVGAEFWADQR